MLLVCLWLQGLLAEVGVTCDDACAQAEGNDVARRAGQGVKGGRTLKKLMTSFKAMGMRKGSGEPLPSRPRSYPKPWDVPSFPNNYFPRCPEIKTCVVTGRATTHIDLCCALA